MMRLEFKEEYDAYALRVKRLIPRIW